VNFRSIVLDVDSTLCGIEGIDWLAEKRGAAVAADVAAQTDRAMRGELTLEEVYGARLEVVLPSADDVADLAAAYRESLAPGAADAIRSWREYGIRIVLVSSGIRQAITPLALDLGIPESDVRAVDLRFHANGGYRGFDAASPLTTAGGKRIVVEAMDLARPSLAAGDGVTDLAMREVVDRFCVFTGFASRSSVIERADCTVSSFAELASIMGRVSFEAETQKLKKRSDGCNGFDG
jgi:phosphoserine phosphatase